MANRRTRPAGLVAVEFETISLTNSTAVGFNSTSKYGCVFHLSVETNDVRYRADGTDPALTTGVLLQKDADYWWYDPDPSDLKFQRSTGSASVAVMAYKYAGDPSTR